MICDQNGLGKTLILLATFFYATQYVEGGRKKKLERLALETRLSMCSGPLRLEGIQYTTYY
jgi:hypothetical protein